MGLLDGRVAIVTGAGRGIGKSVATLLAAEGAAVLVNDLGAALDGSGTDGGPADQVVTEITQAGGRAAANGADVSDHGAAQALIESAVEQFGRLDVLVNTAGILRDRMIFNLSEQDWDAVIRVHLRGTFSPTHWAAVHWRDRTKAGQRTAEMSAILILHNVFVGCDWPGSHESCGWVRCGAHTGGHHRSVDVPRTHHPPYPSIEIPPVNIPVVR